MSLVVVAAVAEHRNRGVIRYFFSIFFRCIPLVFVCVYLSDADHSGVLVRFHGGARFFGGAVRELRLRRRGVRVS